MSFISCPGYAPAPSAEEERQLFFKGLPLFLANTERILKEPELYFCAPSCCWTSFAYIAGGPLCLGYLTEAYEAAVLTDTCLHCGGTLYIYCFGGSCLSGANFVSGYCLACNADSKIRHGLRFMERLQFVLDLRRRQPMFARQKVEYEGQKFTWGGTGLEPAVKTRLVTKRLGAPLELAQLIERLS